MFYSPTAIPTPSITAVEQMSQSTVNVNIAVDSTECAATYLVNAYQNGDSVVISASSSTQPVAVSDLDVCRYNYEFMGNVITAGGVAGDTSSPLSFIANLSGEY